MSSASSEQQIIRWYEAAAHTSVDDGKLRETVVEHVERVAGEVNRRLNDGDVSFRRLAQVAALLHDVGKATPWFQSYLRGEEPPSLRSRHSLVGAILAWHLTKRWPLDERASLLQTIARHHGRLQRSPLSEVETLRNELERPEDELGDVLVDQLAHLDLDGIGHWLSPLAEQLELEGGSLDRDAVRASFLKVSRLAWKRAVKAAGERDLDGFIRDWTVYGSLIGADRTDTATRGVSFTRAALPNQPVERYVKSRFGEPHDEMGRLREQLSSDVHEALLEHGHEERLFTITAPTGSGKTLTALRAVLGLREARSARTGFTSRVIYCLPFTSVIDQNHQVFAEVLCGASTEPPPSDILLKHHHLTPKTYKDSAEREWEADGVGPLLVENWQSEVIVSTFHQLLHTFFSGRSQDAMRASAWVGATIVLDEVQAIPLKYWAPVGRLLVRAAEVLDARVLLMTATRPLIFPDGVGVELLSEHRDYFERLDRVDLVLDHEREQDIEESSQLVVDASERGAVLLIVNTRAAVRELYRALVSRVGESRVVALSTTLTPWDRKRCISEISERVEQEPLIVVSTQLVEAGVDLSFTTVIRDLAPLDSVIQAAGRCNRHGGGERGQVKLISMAPFGGSRRRPSQMVYDSVLLDATRDALHFVAAGEHRLGESRFLELSEAYFTICRDRSQSVNVDALAASGSYRELMDQFVLIEERASRLWFVPRCDAAREVWETWIDGIRELDDRERGSKAWFAARARLRSIRQQLLEHVVREPVGESESDQQIHRLPEERYHPMLGLVPKGWSHE